MVCPIYLMLLEMIGRCYGTPLNIIAEVDTIPRQRELVMRGKGVLVTPIAGFFDWPKNGPQFARLIGQDIACQSALVPADKATGGAALKALSGLVVSLKRALVDIGHWSGVE